MKKYIYILLILTIAGCKSQRVVSEKLETSQSDVSTERSRDYERDSIIVRDSVIVFARADTVYKERWRTEYKDRVVTKTDTLVQEVERLVEKRVVEERKVVPRWCWWCLGTTIFLLLAAIAATIIRVRRLF